MDTGWVTGTRGCGTDTDPPLYPTAGYPSLSSKFLEGRHLSKVRGSEGPPVLSPADEGRGEGTPSLMSGLSEGSFPGLL